LHLAKVINSRTRGWTFTATTVLSIAIWLFMAVAEVCTPLHAWLHGGAIKDNDDCAVVAVAHGAVEIVACATPAAVPLIWIEIVPPIENIEFVSSIAFLPDGRGPPVSFVHT
jgi:hypothetical protein